MTLIMDLGAHYLYLIIILISIIVWLTVTFLTKPEPIETLQKFYDRVRPGGLWKPILQSMPEKLYTDTIMNKHLIFKWISAALVVFGSLFGIGNFVFMNFWGSVVCVSFVVIGRILLYFQNKKT